MNIWSSWTVQTQCLNFWYWLGVLKHYCLWSWPQRKWGRKRKKGKKNEGGNSICSWGWREWGGGGGGGGGVREGTLQGKGDNQAAEDNGNLLIFCWVLWNMVLAVCLLDTNLSCHRLITFDWCAAVLEKMSYCHVSLFDWDGAGSCRLHCCYSFSVTVSIS